MLRETLKRALIYPMLVRSTRRREPLSVIETRSASTASDANDSSYVCGIGPEGSSVVFRAAFRHEKPAELWVALRFEGGPELRAPREVETARAGFRLGGLTLTCLELGRRWGVVYDGLLIQGGREVAARVELEFRATGPVVDFRDAKDDWRVAQTIAAQRWDRRFFAELRELHQVHIEQTGRLVGEVVLDGARRAIDWPSVRDHSFGKRRWSTMTRHGWFFAALDDGRSICASRAKYAFIDELGAGYVAHGDALDAVVESEPLASFAGDDPGLQEHRMWLRTRSGREHTLRARYSHCHAFDMDGGVYRIREGMAHFELDGVPGRGVAELGWNRDHFPRVFAAPAS